MQKRTDIEVSWGDRLPQMGREQGRKEGRDEGIKEGRKEGEQKMLLHILVTHRRINLQPPSACPLVKFGRYMAAVLIFS